MTGAIGDIITTPPKRWGTDVFNTLWYILSAPLRRVLTDAVHDAMVEFAVDDPRAGGPYHCRKCERVTECGTCSECQPLAYARQCSDCGG